MTVSLAPRVRLALYVLTLLGTPLVAYLNAKGIIGDLEVIFWSAEVTAVTGMAALNTSDPKPKGGTPNQFDYGDGLPPAA